MIGKKVIIRADNINEEWVSINGYEGLYEVSTSGRVRSLPKKHGFLLKNLRIKKPVIDKYGYYRMNLWKGGKRETVLVHRLVAKAFITNKLNLKEVNHKNEIKTDNRVENLEWCDVRYNSNYGSRNERISKNMIGKNINSKSLSKPVARYSTQGELLEIYPSSMEAHRTTGIDASGIVKCCKGKNKVIGGYCWKYV